jgi:hypothetical protein
MSERYRPGCDMEASERRTVLDRYPAATSAYVESGAIVYDGATGPELGAAIAGDWAVEVT